MCGQSRCQDQSCRNGADLEVMFGGGEDSAQSQDGQDIGIPSQGSEETDGAERHLPIFQPKRKPIAPSVPSRISSCDSHSSSEQSMVGRAQSYVPRATAASGEHRNEYTSEMIEDELWQLQCGARIVSSRPRLT